MLNHKSSIINHKLFIGLGNPGAKYQYNRHNLGFMAVDEIARLLKAPAWSEKFSGLITKIKLSSPPKSGDPRHDKTQIPGQAGDDMEAFLFKPMDFMNNSGPPSAQLANFYKIPLENIYVFHDELDVELGKIKIKQGGGDGGHNGIKSLDAHLGKDYWRVRLGISHPGDKDLVHSHVLSNFLQDEEPIVAKSTKIIAENIASLLQGDRNLFLTKYFESFEPPRPKPEKKIITENIK